MARKAIEGYKRLLKRYWQVISAPGWHDGRLRGLSTSMADLMDRMTPEEGREAWQAQWKEYSKKISP